jgi:hypothetical protein
VFRLGRTPTGIAFDCMCAFVCEIRLSMVICTTASYMYFCLVCSNEPAIAILFVSALTTADYVDARPEHVSRLCNYSCYRQVFNSVPF